MQRPSLTFRSIHLLIKQAIQVRLPSLESHIFFPNIQHASHLVWLKKQIAFQIQDRPISLQQACHIQSAYRSLGFQLVWILDKRYFNQKNPSLTEHFLRSQIAYFASLDAKQHVMIYDQFEIISQGKRLFQSPPLPIDLSHPFYLKAPFDLSPFKLPWLKKRLSSYSLFFRGDLIDRFKLNPSHVSGCAELEQELLTRQAKTGKKRLISLYSALLHHLLKKATI